METCPCDTGLPLGECCRPVISGEREASTAVELMRSRYSAFVLGEIDWIMSSHHPDTVGEVDRDQVQEWSRDSEWLGLKILETRDGEPGNDDGIVHFRARYRAAGHQVDHVEWAYFTRLDGAWRFHSVLDDPDAPELVPVMAASTVGRNDPCPCGSGRKYKKCCAVPG